MNNTEDIQINVLGHVRSYLEQISDNRAKQLKLLSAACSIFFLWIVFFHLHSATEPESLDLYPNGVALSVPAPLLVNSTYRYNPLGELEMLPAGRTVSLASSSSCPWGLVYVYELPSEFNADLLRGCKTLVPWADLCPFVDNNGLGIGLNMPSWMGDNFWYLTSQFGGEVMYHVRTLAHPCRTMDANEASAFFIPYYAGLDVMRYLFVPSTPKQRDELSIKLLEWLQAQDTWKKNRGRDHFLMIGRITWDFRREPSSLWDMMWGRSGWGSDLFKRNAMMNGPLRMIIEKNVNDGREVAVPYPTSFHPRSMDDVFKWQSMAASAKRTLLFSYAGGPRPQFPNDFRGLLLNQCRQAPSECRSFDCSEQRCEHPLAVMELFLDSIFCLQPRGDSFTRRSIFDSIIAGCIPVFFWHRTAYLQYGWHLPPKPDSYSVFIDRTEIRNGKRSIRDVLSGFSQRRIQKLREGVLAIIPRIVYMLPPWNLTTSAITGHQPTPLHDAFDIAIDGILQQLAASKGSSAAAV